MRKVAILVLIIMLSFVWSSCVIVRKKDSLEELAQKMYRKTPKNTYELPPAGMIFIPEGDFLMGNHERKNYSRQPVKAFYIDRYEVTCAEYKKFVASVGYKAPSNWPEGIIPTGKENHPVTGVSLVDAQAYAKWAGKRLPTVIEWEKAARGIKANTWPWGNKFSAVVLNCKESYIGGTVPVGTYLKGVSPFGCYDMAGNAWEWTTTEYDPPPDKSIKPTIYDMWSKSRFWKTLPELMNKWRRRSRYFKFNPSQEKLELSKPDPYEKSPRLFLLRGGGWNSGYLDTRTYSIMGLPRDYRHPIVGFRCAMDAVPWRSKQPR